METGPESVAQSDLDETSQRIDRTFDLQQKNRWILAKTTARERIAKLRKIMNWIYSNKDLIREALYADFRKPAAETDLQEIYVTLIGLKHTVRHLKKWMRPHFVPRSLQLITARPWIEYRPRGVVLIISPWNFPFLLSVEPVISAIAAGNSVFIKPSEYSPNTSRLVSRMMEELFPENEVAVFEGAKEVASLLLKKPFDHIFFTGNTEVGKIVMRAAAENLASVTLELGGKSPAVVDESADIREAAHKIAWGKYINSGQTCVAPDYALVHESKAEDFVEAVKSEIKRAYGETEGDRRAANDFARIISPRHFQRLQKIFDESVNRGCRVEIGGETAGKEKYFAPTVVTHVKDEALLMQEEIFGPVLPVVPFKSLDDAIGMINSRKKPLAIYIFSKKSRNIRRLLSETASGGSCINDVVLQYAHSHLPFGGINHSGFGNAHGFYGFRAFSYERAILQSNRFNPMKIFYPPYTPRVRKLINLAMKYF